MTYQINYEQTNEETKVRAYLSIEAPTRDKCIRNAIILADDIGDWEIVGEQDESN